MTTMRGPFEEGWDAEGLRREEEGRMNVLDRFVVRFVDWLFRLDGS